MAILAENKGKHIEPIPAGMYVARCYRMIQIGTVVESFKGDEKTLHKVRIGFELPSELKVFNEEKVEQPCVIDEEFTLSLYEKSTLRKMLESWRGKKFTDEESEKFDITKLLGVPCMLNIIHNEGKNGNMYAKIGSISPLMKGMVCPDQINPTFVLSYDNFNWTKFESLPEFIKEKMKRSAEYKTLSKVDSKPEDAKSIDWLTEQNDDKPPF